MNDFRIYYSSLAAPHVISSSCSRWDNSDYTVTFETWLTKSQLNTLRNNIVPGATSELYEILNQPTYYDQTWAGKNTIKIVGYDDSYSNLPYAKGQMILYVKSIQDMPITASDTYLNVKIEGYISGSGY